MTDLDTWLTGVGSEVAFWDKWFSTHGSEYGEESYRWALDPDRLMPEYLAALIPADVEVPWVLDVGAGPVSRLRPRMPDGRVARLFAIDPLAHRYDMMLEKYGVTPPVRTTFGEAERLHVQFDEGTFDLVYARNCLDHSVDPKRALLSIVKILKPLRCAFLEHSVNEGRRNAYAGLHKWDFFQDDGGFRVMNKRGVSFTAEEVLRDIASVTTAYLPVMWFRAVVCKYDA